MRTRLFAEKPGDILFTLKIEATAAEFETLRDALGYLPKNGPNAIARQLETDLNSLLAQARKIFYPISR